MRSLEERILRGYKHITQANNQGRDTTKWKQHLNDLEKQLIIERNTESNRIDTVSDYSSDDDTSKFPHWYTEADKKVTMVQKGICNNCFHLRLVFNNGDSYELREAWCSALRQKLEQKINNCDAFYAVGDEIEKLVDNQAMNHHKTTNKS